MRRSFGLNFFFRFTLAFLVAVSLLLGTVSYWLPALVPRISSWYGLEVVRVERLAGGGLVLHDVSMRREGFRLKADVVNLPAVWGYLIQRFLKGRFHPETAVAINEIEIVLLSNSSSRTASAGPIPVEVLDQIQNGVEGLAPWLPRVEVSAFRIQLKSNDQARVAFRGLVYDERKIRIGSLSFGPLPQFEVQLELPEDAAWTIRAEASELSAEMALLKEGSAWDLGGEFRHGPDVIQAEARLEADLSFPSSATLRTSSFTIPPGWFSQYISFGPESPSMEGPIAIQNFDLEWSGVSYQGVLEMGATSDAGVLGVEEFSVALAFNGNLEAVNVTKGQIRSEILGAELSGPVRFGFESWTIHEPVGLNVWAELSHFPELNVEGRIEAQLDFEPEVAGGLAVEFDFGVDHLVYRGHAIDQVRAVGRYAEGLVVLEHLRGEPANVAAGNFIETSGSIRPSTETIDLKFELQAEDVSWLNMLVGGSYFTGGQQASGSIRGTLENVAVEGEAALGIEIKGMTPARIETVFGFHGIEHFSLTGKARNTQAGVDWSLQGGVIGDELRLELKQLTLIDSERPLLRLSEPTRILVDLSSGKGHLEERLRIESFDFRGEDAFLQGHWTPESGIYVEASNLSSVPLNSWLDVELPLILLDRVELELTQLRPWLEGRLAFRSVRSELNGKNIQLNLNGALRNESLQFDALDFRFDGESLVTGDVVAPLRLKLPATSDEPFWEWTDTGQFGGELSLRSTPNFLEWFREYAGLDFGAAELTLNISGDPEEAKAHVQANADFVRLIRPGEKWPLPELTKLKLEARLDPATVTVEKVQFLLNESRVAGGISFPMQSLRTQLFESRSGLLEFVSSASGWLELDQWKLENWTSMLPSMVRQSGELGGRLEWTPGFEVNGSLDFRDLALRPTDGMPSIDTMEGRLALSERRLVFEEVRAKVGGSPVTILGHLNASNLNDLTWQCSIMGSDVPLIRTTDLILRTDLNIDFSRTEAMETPLLSGKVNLRSGTLLLEFDPLSSSVEGGPSQRPPFFSISEAPFGDWRFDLSLKGDDFLRVRSPYLRARLSADFGLQGTFALPELIGSLRATEAVVYFPGATMHIDHGEAFIEKADPKQLQLDITGIAKTGSYIVTMEVGQTLENPQFRFQSTPSLKNISILRLLATGSTVGGGVGTAGLYLGKGFFGGGGMGESLVDKLTVDVGEEISRSGRNTLGVRYELNEDLLLEGEYDKYDAYNVDLIWKILER